MVLKCWMDVSYVDVDPQLGSNNSQPLHKQSLTYQIEKTRLEMQ